MGGDEGKGNENECECSVIEVIDYYIKRSIPLEHYTIGCKKKRSQRIIFTQFFDERHCGFIKLGTLHLLAKIRFATCG